MPDTTPPAVLRQRIADAVQPLLMDTLPKPVAAARAQEVADAVLPLVAEARTVGHASCYVCQPCGFHWHGRTPGEVVPMRDGQPVCPRCELDRLSGGR